MSQMNLFDMTSEKEKRQKSFNEFNTWRNLPERTHIDADSKDRPQVREMLRKKWKLYSAAHHVCSKLPGDRYIWLNYVENPEYWVLNKVGGPVGEYVETCPYCGADLKHGGGDVVLLKTSSRIWRSDTYVSRK